MPIRSGILRITAGGKTFEERYANMQEAEAVRDEYVRLVESDGGLQLKDGTRLEGEMTFWTGEIQIEATTVPNPPKQNL